MPAAQRTARPRGSRNKAAAATAAEPQAARLPRLRLAVLGEAPYPRGLRVPLGPIRNRLLSLFGKCHAVVLLYHRVDDDYLDSTTVGVEQFQRQLAALRGYDVLGIEEFLATRGQPRRRPCVVLTFDDGYASKFLAALLLRRQGLPCTFFLATRMIGTDVPFAHDLCALGRRVPSLTWEQVKTMADWGFTFGIHTLNHARLAALPTAEALAEVAGAKDELEQRLGPSTAMRCLGYPFGAKADISDEIRRSLKSIGVDWCFSAYGGVNRPNWDPLNVLRCGVDHSMSGLVFRAIVEGWCARKSDLSRTAERRAAGNGLASRPRNGPKRNSIRAKVLRRNSELPCGIQLTAGVLPRINECTDMCLALALRCTNCVAGRGRRCGRGKTFGTTAPETRLARSYK